MKIPNRLKIASHNFSVIKDYSWKERGDICGQVLTDASEIRLPSRQKNSVRRISDSTYDCVFFHEIVHAVSEIYLPKDAQLSENQVCLISEGLMAVIKDNRLFAEERKNDRTRKKRKTRKKRV